MDTISERPAEKNDGGASAQVPYQVQRIMLDDLAALESFYRTFHPHRPRLLDMAVWRWEFSLNPAAPERLPFFVIKREGTIHGGIGMVPFTLEVGGDRVQASFPANFFIDPAFKGLPALRLMKAMQQEYPVTVASYISDDTRKLFGMARFVDLGDHLKDHFYTLRAVRQAGQTLPDRLKTLLFLAARRAWLAVIRVYAENRCDRRTRIHVSRTLEARHIPASPAGDRGEKIAIRKDAAYLAWRYQQSPALDCTFLTLIRADEPLLLAVLHYDAATRSAVLLDVVGRDFTGPQILLLLAAVVREGIRREAVQLKTTLLDAELSKALAMLGFSDRESGHGLMIHCRVPELADRLARADDWRFMLGDTDNY